MKKYIPYAIIAVLLIVIFSTRQEEIVIDIPAKENTKVIEAPEPIVKIDTFLLEGKLKVVSIPNPVNSELLDRYNKLKDSVSKKALFEEVITENNYLETLEDSTQIITVSSKVIGTLTEQIISYRTHPIKIVRKSLKRKTALYLGAYTLIPTPTDIHAPSVGVKFDIVSQKSVFTGGFDTNRNILIGATFRVFN